MSGARCREEERGARRVRRPRPSRVRLRSPQTPHKKQPSAVCFRSFASGNLDPPQVDRINTNCVQSTSEKNPYFRTRYFPPTSQSTIETHNLGLSATRQLGRFQLLGSVRFVVKLQGCQKWVPLVSFVFVFDFARKINCFLSCLAKQIEQHDKRADLDKGPPPARQLCEFDAEKRATL